MIERLAEAGGTDGLLRKTESVDELTSKDIQAYQLPNDRFWRKAAVHLKADVG